MFEFMAQLRQALGLMNLAEFLRARSVPPSAVQPSSTDLDLVATSGGVVRHLSAGAAGLATSAALAAHLADASDAHDASAISILDAANDFTATDVEGALAELQADAEADDAALAAHLADTSDAHDASAISADSTTLVGVGTDVQAVLEELDNAIVAAETATANHLADTSDAHDASAISNVAAGTISATDVQAAINELDTEKATTGSVSTVASDLAAHLADTSDAHDASAISILDAANDFTATDVEGALAELQADHETDEAALAAHLADSSDAHDASAISILDTANDFTATDVEGALAELQSDHETDEANLAAHLADTSDAHDASAVSYAGTSGVSATDVEGALDEAFVRYEAHEAFRSAIDYAQDLAQDAIKEATTLDDAMERKIEFELSEKADRIHEHPAYRGGAELSGGYAQKTANSAGAVDVASITVLGDGVTPVMVQCWALSMTSTTAGATCDVYIRDGAGGTGTLYAQQQNHVPTASYGTAVNCWARVAAWSGARTFYFYFTVSAGTGTLLGAATYPAFIRATWTG